MTASGEAQSLGERTREVDPVLARFEQPTTDEQTRIAVLSDLHLATEQRGTSRVLHRTEQRLASAVRSINEQPIDAVLFSGDLVQNGDRAEFDAFDRIVEELEAPFFAVPGNHDLIRREDGDRTALTLPEFEDRYTPNGLPFRERIGGVDVIGLSSNASTRESVAESYVGCVSEATLSWLDDALADAACPVVSVHHTLDAVRSGHHDERAQLPIENSPCPAFENAAALTRVLTKHDAPLVLTGHLHVPSVARIGRTREFTVPPLGPFPCGYTVLEIGSRGTRAVFHTVTDREGQAEALGFGLDNHRILLAASHLAALPLVDEFADPGE